MSWSVFDLVARDDLRLLDPSKALAVATGKTHGAYLAIALAIALIYDSVASSYLNFDRI